MSANDAPESFLLMPKYTHRFTVTFLDDNSQPMCNSTYLTKQVLAIKDIFEGGELAESELGDKSSQFTLVIEDDATNKAMSVVRPLYEDARRFTTVISMLDGDANVVSTETYHQCIISQIKYSDRTYGGDYIRKHININLPRWVGDVVNILTGGTKGKKLNSTALSLTTTTSDPRSTMQVTLVVDYCSVEHNLCV